MRFLCVIQIVPWALPPQSVSLVSLAHLVYLPVLLVANSKQDQSWDIFFSPSNFVLKPCLQLKLDLQALSCLNNFFFHFLKFGYRGPCSGAFPSEFCNGDFPVSLTQALHL